MKFAHSAVAMRLPLSVRDATLGAKSAADSGVFDVVGPMAIADGQLVLLAGSDGELAEELGARPHFVGQRRADLVDAIPLRLARVARRPVEEHAVLQDRAADPARRHHLRRQQRVAERSGLDAGGEQVVRKLVGADQLSGSQSIRPTPENRFEPLRLTALTTVPAVRPNSALMPPRLMLTSAMSSSLISVLR